MTAGLSCIPGLTCTGCILGELLGGKPIFPGTSTMNQLDRILEVTGRPSAEDIDAIQSPFASTMLDSLPKSDPRPLHHMFPNASPEATDLLSKLLQVGCHDISLNSSHSPTLCVLSWYLHQGLSCAHEGQDHQRLSIDM